MEALNKLSLQAESFINPVLANPYIMAVLKVTLALYASNVAPKLPESIMNIFNNTFFKILYITLMVYISEHDFQLAILLACVYVVGFNVLSGRGPFESFDNFNSEFKPDFKAKLLEPKLNIYPGCHSITMNDLLHAFDNDALKLQKTVEFAFQELLSKSNSKNEKERLMNISYLLGLPYNVEFNDENAPLIATILMNHGFSFGTCTAPQ